MRVHRGHWHAGLRRFDAPDEVFELQDCPITDERVLLAWKLVLDQERLLPRATELRAAVRLLPEAFAFTVEGGHEWRESRAFHDAIPSLGELWWIPQGKGRRLMHSRIAVEHAGASFTQVNAGVAARLQAWVIDLARAVRPRTVVDAYAGTGDMAVALAADGARVTAIEIDRDAVRICASRLPEGSRAIARPVEVELPKVLPADVVILNPPRAGLDARVAQILETQKPAPQRVVYVSCNPATLARDVRRMGSYRVRSLRGFDMFPQTAHVETVCELEPAA
jgi:23S rRNA (uracil1939-C5)-methyltransferase